jgi:hypothetical protein
VLPTKLPTVLPTKLPTVLPTVLPKKLPTVLPTKTMIILATPTSSLTERMETAVARSASGALHVIGKQKTGGQHRQ